MVWILQMALYHVYQQDFTWSWRSSDCSRGVLVWDHVWPVLPHLPPPSCSTWEMLACVVAWQGSWRSKESVLRVPVTYARRQMKLDWRACESIRWVGRLQPVVGTWPLPLMRTSVQLVLLTGTGWPAKLRRCTLWPLTETLPTPVLREPQHDDWLLGWWCYSLSHGLWHCGLRVFPCPNSESLFLGTKSSFSMRMISLF